MAATSIQTEGLSKLYRLGSGEAGAFKYDRLTEALSRAIRRRHGPKEEQRTIWALKDVTMEVNDGDVLGIIGRNGAGKTTLLKVLSRITQPTEGYAKLHGRVGSLLEVGTGFHPELTGRENIFLNGAILGMKRAEMRSKFDQIVAFAEVERFIDTPVKRYSSGMFVRLAFAVAAHLEPEILIVDEVLSVGDANFQKKCLGRMEEIGSGGRTVLFVSHNAPAVLRLCNRVVLLDKGRVVADGKPKSVVSEYLLSPMGSRASRNWPSKQEAPGDDVVRLKSVQVLDERSEASDEVDITRPVAIQVEYWHLANDPALRPSVNLHFYNDEGTCLFLTNDFNNKSWWHRSRAPGLVKATCHIPGNFLAEGQVFVLAAISSFNPTIVHVAERDAVSFQVVDRSSGDGVRGDYVNEWPGVVRPMLDWTIEAE